jgi:hypothetical protein
MEKEPIHVGFDMDGVLLYNPFRIVRPIVVTVKKYLLKRETNKFYLPKTSLEKFLWLIAHKSSFIMAPGIDDIHTLIKEKKIKVYIITSRYSMLKDDCEYWFNKINKEGLFEACYYNEGNEQPYLFKEKMIKKLKLDFFVEDNWDIVSHVNEQLKNDHKPTKVLWIYNLIDKNIPYEYKFPTLRKAVEYITRNT